MNPLLSFIIPVYNGEMFVRKCLNSIISIPVNKELYEIIVIDDGSTDKTSSILKDFQEKNPLYSISIITQKNQGQSTARNIGIERAVGSYIWFVDSDDILEKGGAAYLFTYLQENKWVEIVSFKSISGDFNNENTIPYKGQSKTEKCKEIKFAGEQFLMSSLFSHYVWRYIIKRKILIDNGLRFVPGKLIEDAPFMGALILKAKTVIYIDIVAYIYVLRPDSIMHNLDRAKMERLFKGYEYAAEAYHNLGNECDGDVRDFLYKRRDYFVLFLFIRVLRYGNRQQIEQTVARLKSKNFYPIRSNPIDLPLPKSFGYRLLRGVINRPAAMKFLNRIFRLKK